MNSRLSIPISIRKAEAGFTLIELLVTLVIACMMMTLMTGFFQATVATRQEMSMQTEAQQGLRALFEMISQELRQAGACLPQQGQFIALEGTDDGNQDILTLRIGKTDQDTLVCIQAGTTVAAANGATTLTVAPGNGTLFSSGTRVYVTPNGASGSFYTVASSTSTTVTLTAGLQGSHPVGSGIYAVDERTYSVEGTNDNPVLTVSIDGGSSYPLVAGVDEFNVQYLIGPCDETNPESASSCADVTAEPADDDEWHQVREVVISATVLSQQKDKKGEYLSEHGDIHVKPRNLL